MSICPALSVGLAHARPNKTLCGEREQGSVVGRGRLLLVSEPDSRESGSETSLLPCPPVVSCHCRGVRRIFVGGVTLVALTQFMDMDLACEFKAPTC